MRKTNNWFVSTMLVIAMMASSVLVMAQDPPASQKQKVRGGTIFTRTEGDVQGQEMPPPPPGPMKTSFQISADFIATEASFDTQVVTAAPFSAVAVTESTQVLADGNRIVHRSSSTIYRDAQGRTRREQTLNLPTGESLESVWINDPVAGFNYTLNDRDHIAQKGPVSFGVIGMAIGSGGGGSVGRMTAAPTLSVAGVAIRPTKAPTANTAPGTAAPSGEGAVAYPRSGAPIAVQGSKTVQDTYQSGYEAGARTKDGVVTRVQTFKTLEPVGEAVKQESTSLGKQTIEGIEAEGTKITITIPAGQIGNEQPIIIETENWYSADLHQLVMSRHSDPRFGETTYKLTNISRNEPDQSLFQVPSDYTVKEAFTPRPTMMKQRKPDEEKQPQQ